MVVWNRGRRWRVAVEDVSRRGAFRGITNFRRCFVGLVGRFGYGDSNKTSRLAVDLGFDTTASLSYLHSECCSFGAIIPTPATLVLGEP